MWVVPESSLESFGVQAKLAFSGLVFSLGIYVTSMDSKDYSASGIIVQTVCETLNPEPGIPTLYTNFPKLLHHPKPYLNPE